MWTFTRFVLVTSLIAACGPGLVKLDRGKVRRLELQLVGGGTAVCPARGVPEVVAIVAYDEKTHLQTRTPGNPNGTLRPTDFEWGSDMGSIDAEGRLILPDLLSWYDRTFRVRAAVPDRPEITAELELTPRFDCGGLGAFDGADGQSGYTGGDGGDAGPGPRVDVALAYIDTTLNGRLVMVRVMQQGDAGAYYYLMDRKGTSAPFVVTARGGDGGAGGSGAAGSGGSAGTRGTSGSSGGTCQDGTDGTDGGNGQDGGDGGPGGNGGDGGRGGEIVVSYPPGFPELPATLTLEVEGGAAGYTGSGGSGGSGGLGGNGGSGGSAGSTYQSSGSGSTYCSTSSGRSGRDGQRGRDGNRGSAGGYGRPGAQGIVSSRSVDVEQLFAAEIARGWRIAKQ